MNEPLDQHQAVAGPGPSTDQHQQSREQLMELDNSPQPTIKDYEAFANKHMPDLGVEIEDFQVQTWRVQNWSQAQKRLVGADFQCGGHKWRILIFPQGNANGQPNDMVSVYLDYADPKGAPDGWHACAQFALAISNPNDPSVFTVSHAHHRFVAEECDWGFTRFADLRKLQTAQEGQTVPTIDQDEVDVTAFVRVLKDPTGVLWHNFVNYDSKQFTGYVGLKNQGATCYMNSLLQSLFHTSYFRKAVYQIPTEDDTPSESVALALQRVFYNLQTSDQSVGTNELTKSFGWKSLDSFMQHDVQEFNRVLSDKLEQKMKGTEAEGALHRLFVGKMKSYIKCINVEYESAREEEYYDVQLNVKGMKDVAESFRDYISVETMDGENRYQAGDEFGLQDARKGVIFQTFPPVLHLQLKRFEYDFQRDSLVKINDRYEYPFEIDLAEYLDEGADLTQNYKYKLHGVLVHAGDLHGGHYFALIKPEKDGKWFKYDDDRVTPVTDKEVLEDNYGGEIISPATANLPRNAARPAKRFTNAYMLVYVRESAAEEVLKPFTEGDTPSHLRKRLEDEKQQLDTKKREKEEQHLYLTAKLITDSTFKQHQGFDLACFEDKNVPPSNLPAYRVLKTETYKTFKTRVAQAMQIPVANFRLWILVNRQNKTVRPDSPVEELEGVTTMEQIRNSMANRQSDLRLYLDYEPKAEFISQLHGNHQHYSMIFLKQFDVSSQTLLGVTKRYIQRGSKVQDIIPLIQEMMGWPASTPVKLYEEIKPGMIEVMKLKHTFAVSEIQDGDVICFQVDYGTEKEAETAASSQIPNAPAFYEYLQNRILTRFKSKSEADWSDPNTTFDLMLAKKMTYDQMANRVADALGGVDPLKIRFTQASLQTNAPKAIVKRSSNQNVSEMLSGSLTHTGTGQMSTLFYEKLDVSIVELETKKSLKITWTGVSNKDEGTHSFLLPKTTTMDQLGEQHLAKDITLSPEGSRRIRFFEITNAGRRKDRDYGGSEMIGNLPEGVEIYAEEVPVEELNMQEGETLISAFHFSKEPSRWHGIPFRFVVKPGEKFADTKKRIQIRTGASSKDFAKYRFALILTDTSGYKQPNAIEDEDEISEHKFTNTDFLGIDHQDKSGKSRNGGVVEKAIHIR